MTDDGVKRSREECLRAAAQVVLLAAIRIAREDALASPEAG